MAAARRFQLGELQLAILKVLWDRGPSGVDGVRRHLDRKRRPAYTTVATVLRRMEDEGLVGHREDGRRFIYQAEVEPDSVAGSMARDLLDRLFEGSLADMVAHLLSGHEVDPDEIDRLEQIIAERKDRS